jgi:hypothetical protein
MSAVDIDDMIIAMSREERAARAAVLRRISDSQKGEAWVGIIPTVPHRESTND